MCASPFNRGYGPNWIKHFVRLFSLSLSLSHTNTHTHTHTNTHHTNKHTGGRATERDGNRRGGDRAIDGGGGGGGKRRTLAWFRHVTWHDSLSKPVTRGTLEGGRCRGRHRKCWMDIKEWTFLSLPEVLTRASCRKDWKRISAVLPLVPLRPVGQLTELTAVLVSWLNWP